MAKPKVKKPTKAPASKKPAPAKPGKAKGGGTGEKPRAAVARKQSKAAKQEQKEGKASIEDPPREVPAAKEVEEDDRDEEEEQPETLAKEEKDDEPAEPKAVVYLGGIPSGFEENQMRKFFGQFGDISKMRIARSAKTARPKGYAFIEFKEASVAKIVADTMDKYLMYGKQMKCHVLEDEKRHPRMFRGAFRRWEDRRPARFKKFRTDYNDRPTLDIDGEELPQATMSQVLKHNKKRKTLKAKLDNYGVEYSLEEVYGDEASGKDRGGLSSLANKAPPAGAEVSKPDATTELQGKTPLTAAQKPAKKKKQRA